MAQRLDLSNLLRIMSLLAYKITIYLHRIIFSRGFLRLKFAYNFLLCQIRNIKFLIYIPKFLIYLTAVSPNIDMSEEVHVHYKIINRTQSYNI
jgi:hypothetical protein